MELTTQNDPPPVKWTIRDLFLVTAMAAISLGVGEFGRENGIGFTSQPDKFPELVPLVRLGALVGAVYFAAWVFIALSLFRIAKQDPAFAVQPGHIMAWITGFSAVAGLLLSLSYATCHYFFAEPTMLGDGRQAVVDPQWLNRFNVTLIIGLAFVKFCVWLIVLLRIKLAWVWRIPFSCLMFTSVLQGAVTFLVAARMSGSLSAIANSGLSATTIGYLNLGVPVLHTIVFLTIILALFVDKIRKRSRDGYHFAGVWLYISQCLVSLGFAAAANLIILG